jgi:hypothetical protein
MPCRLATSSSSSPPANAASRKPWISISITRSPAYPSHQPGDAAPATRLPGRQPCSAHRIRQVPREPRTGQRAHYTRARPQEPAALARMTVSMPLVCLPRVLAAAQRCECWRFACFLSSARECREVPQEPISF